MKKLIMISSLLFMISACGTKNDIKVYNRDSASGTREAFEKIVGIEKISEQSAETTGNGDMAKQVGITENGIGYVSFSTDFEANKLKDIAIDGIYASVESVNNDTYPLARPFSFLTREKGDFDSDRKEQLVLALIDYMTLSIEGKEIILYEGGITDINKAVSWKTLIDKHPIVLEDNRDLILKTGGSTSVEKTLKAVIESFIPLAGNFSFEPNHSGSSDGYKRTLGSEKEGPNKIDIGFASRTFKPDETSKDSMKTGVYSMDAIIVVVNESNESLTSVSLNKLKQFFEGSVQSW